MASIKKEERFEFPGGPIWVLADSEWGVEEIDRYNNLNGITLRELKEGKTISNLKGDI